jgi:hypothetical protein
MEGAVCFIVAVYAQRTNTFMIRSLDAQQNSVHITTVPAAFMPVLTGQDLNPEEYLGHTYSLVPEGAA